MKFIQSRFGVMALSAFASVTLANAQVKPNAQLQLGSRGDEIAFDKAQLSGKAGQTVSLTFKNNASAGSRMQHAWVLVRPGSESKVAEASTTAGAAKNYIPDMPEVLAHTKLLNPGESQTIEFKAPSSAGDYPYICPFPGHYLSMKGTLTLK